MWMVAANFRQTHSPSRLAWSGGGGHPALSLHSSNESGRPKLLQWLWSRWQHYYYYYYYSTIRERRGLSVCDRGYLFLPFPGCIGERIAISESACPSARISLYSQRYTVHTVSKARPCACEKCENFAVADLQSEQGLVCSVFFVFRFSGLKTKSGIQNLGHYVF